MKEKAFVLNNNQTESIRKIQWQMAIGLQKVDNLKPSNHLENLIEENIIGKISLEEIIKNLIKYYKKQSEINYNELECDFVSTRIVELLQEDKFELSVDYLKYVHEYLFQDVYKFAGNFREVDFSKPEIILNKDSVAYGDSNTLKESLEYDISQELDKYYKEMNMVEVLY